MTELYDHPEYLALCRAVRANPDCDLPRKVVADWLRDHGDEDRATYIQCELEIRADRPRVCQKNGFPLAWRNNHSSRHAGLLYRPRCRCVTCATIRRAYLASRRHKYVSWEARIIRPVVRRQLFTANPAGSIWLWWCRGFIQEAYMTTVGDWMEYGPLLLREHPVQKVMFRDYDRTRPYHTPVDPNAGLPPDEWDAVWFESSDHPAGDAPWELPMEIYNLLPRRHFPFAEFDDAETPEDAAYTALSEACLKWADTRAGTGQ